MRKLALLSFLCAAAACAQSLSIGVIGGAPFQDVVKATTSTTSGPFGVIQAIPKSNNFTIGPALRVNLPASFRFEVDALYRPYGVSFGGNKFGEDVSGRQFRFPVLLQYRFGTPVIKPFIEGGLSFDHIQGISDAAKSITSGPGALLHTSATGIVLGAGVDVKIPLVKLSAEIRYTRDTVSHFSDFSNLNQAEVLFGVHF